MTDERKIWEGRPSQWLNLGHWVASVVTMGLWLPVALWNYLVVRCTEYGASSQRFFLRHGVLSRVEDEIELYRIKDTRLEQPLLLRLVGLANIVLVSSDPPAKNAVIRVVSNAKQLREELRTAIEKRRSDKRVREVDFAA